MPAVKQKELVASATESWESLSPFHPMLPWGVKQTGEGQTCATLVPRLHALLEDLHMLRVSHVVPRALLR